MGTGPGLNGKSLASTKASLLLPEARQEVTDHQQPVQPKLGTASPVQSCHTSSMS
jgi:hypothetical protein